MQQFQQVPTQTRMPVLVFLKTVGPPLVLYVENPEEVYREIAEIIKNANERSPKLIEKKANGPLKSIAFLDVQLAGVALQEEKFVAY
jgi:hypothetical protein